MKMDKAALTMRISNEANGTTRAILSGDITEDSDFARLAAATSNLLVIDLADVRRINSTGVREWIKFVNQMHRQGRALLFERCSVAIVQQLNMISNFRGSGRVRSVLAPYYCEGCDENHVELIDLEKGPPPKLALTLPCPRCGSAMEFDEIPESYLAFRDY
jgi:anti-anti-sigma regulatory factor